MICPICNKDTLDVTKERVGPIGYRENEYVLHKKCKCRIADCETIALAIENYNVNLGTIKTIYSSQEITSEICIDCGKHKPVVKYPINPYIGLYKEICLDCFKNEIEIINELRDNR